MGNSSSAANRDALSHSGFLWIHPTQSHIEDELDSREAYSDDCSEEAASHEVRRPTPLPAWFEADDVAHVLHWQGTQLDDIFLLEDETVEAATCSAVANRRRSVLTRINKVPLTDVVSVRLSASRASHSALGPFSFGVEGRTDGMPWKLSLQAPSAPELLNWLGCFRRNIATLYSSLSGPDVSLFQAIQSRDGTALEAALEELERLDWRSPCRDAHGFTPLLAAARNANTSAIKVLSTYDLHCLGTLKDVNLDGKSAVHCAVESRSLKCLRLVLSQVVAHDTSVLEFATVGGMTAFHVAASLRFSDALFALLVAGASWLCTDDGGRTIAHYVASCCESGSVLEAYPDEHCVATAACARFIVTAVPELLDICDCAGNTPLHIAAQYGRLECVEAFLSAAADVTALNREGNTAASIAAGFGHVACVGALREYGGTSNREAAFRLSAMRRGALVAVDNVSAAARLQERMDRVAAVWERVLDAAAKRLDEAKSKPGRLSLPSSHSVAASSRSTKYLEDTTSAKMWSRFMDESTGLAYFMCGKESLWGSGSIPRPDDGMPAWSKHTDVSSSAEYMWNTHVGECEWLASSCTPEVPNFWTLCTDPTSHRYYFVQEGSGWSEWCHDDALSAALPASVWLANSWARNEDPGSGCSFFTHARSGLSFWSTPH